MLTALPGFPKPKGGTGADPHRYPNQMAYLNGRLYVVNNGSNALSVFSVHLQTGALVALPATPIALGTGEWDCVAVHPREHMDRAMETFREYEGCSVIVYDQGCAAELRRKRHRRLAPEPARG